MQHHDSYGAVPQTHLFTLVQSAVEAEAESWTKVSHGSVPEDLGSRQEMAQGMHSPDRVPYISAASAARAQQANRSAPYQRQKIVAATSVAQKDARAP